MGFRISMAAALACAMLEFAACDRAVDKGPATVPLHGKVAFKKGGSIKDLYDHSIIVQFQSVEQPDIVATGEILEDGSFTMVSQVGARGKPGVVPGVHRVRLNADETSARFIAPRFLDYKTSGITVTAPSEKEVAIEVSR